jgi:hypothetical protein
MGYQKPIRFRLRVPMQCLHWTKVAERAGGMRPATQHATRLEQSVPDKNFAKPENTTLKCLPAGAARASAATARSTHLRSTCFGELHAVRSRGTPTLPALELRLPNEKGNLSGETTSRETMLMTSCPTTSSDRHAAPGRIATTFKHSGRSCHTLDEAAWPRLPSQSHTGRSLVNRRLWRSRRS